MNNTNKMFEYRRTYNTSLENVRNLVIQERENIENIPGVSGTGITHSLVTRKLYKDDGFQLMVFVEKITDELRKRIPKKIYTTNIDTPFINVIINEIGKVEAFSYTHRMRPVRPGFSTCNSIWKCAGTISGFPTDTRHPENGTIVLSNNHVFALRIGQSKIQELMGMPVGHKGDAILQPGGYDLGINPDDKYATLERWVHIGPPFPMSWDDDYDPEIPLKYRLGNYVDVAIAKVDTGIDINEDTYCNNGFFRYNGWTDPIIGTFVKKAGRSTECTENYILATDVTLNIGYNQGVFRFREQIVIAGFDYAPFGWSGDSGSLIVHADYNYATGLLFAGNIYGVVIANTMEHVQNSIGISFGQKYEAPVPQPSHKIMTWISCSPACVLKRDEPGNTEDECSCSISGEVNRIYLNVIGNVEPSNCEVFVQKFNGRLFRLGIYQSPFSISEDIGFSCYSKGFRLPIKIYVHPTKGWMLDYIKIKNDTFTDNIITIIPDNYLLENEFKLDIDVHLIELDFVADKCKYQKAFLYTPKY